MKRISEANETRRDLPERTFEFARRIVNLCSALNTASNVSRTLACQLLRSGTSIGANVEEGAGSQSRDFVAKYSIACRKPWASLLARLLSASEIVAAAKLRPLIDESNQLVAILTTIIKKTRRAKEERVNWSDSLLSHSFTLHSSLFRRPRHEAHHYVGHCGFILSRQGGCKRGGCGDCFRTLVG